MKNRKSSKSSAQRPGKSKQSAAYPTTIPSRDAIVTLLTDERRLLKRSEIAAALDVNSAEQREGLRRRLRAMVRDGQLHKNRRGGYGVAAKMDLVTGRVVGHADGFGFVVPDTGGDDLYLHAKQMRKVMHGDRVSASVINVDSRGRLEGAVVEVLERANSHLVGRFYEESGVYFIVADEKRISHDILIAGPDIGEASHGDFVYVELIEQPDTRKQALGRVLSVLGRSINAPVAAEVAILNYDIPHEWPSEVLEQAERTPGHVTDQASSGRKDLREVALVTIDGADAKDFDDAVHCQAKAKDGWKLLVAIADVSHYVPVGTPLDQQAQHRGTSVYFPNRVVPMLPERLSNGICSLNPNVDRLCMVCEMHFDSSGKVTRSRFFDAVMHSHARLTYQQAWEHLEEQRTPDDWSDEVKTSLADLYALFKTLRKRRERRGAIDFDSQEVGFQFDEDGEVQAIVPRGRNEAHLIIEECMIAANVEAAKFVAKQEIPAPFRVHPPPPEQKVADMTDALAPLGLHLPSAEHLKPSDVSKVMAAAKGRPDGQMIQALLLRMQSLATYQTDNGGHFGLALGAYAHFTSPIRRYPDLLLHRAIRHTFKRGERSEFNYSETQMKQLATHCSMTERRAEEASRDVDARLKCAYMQRHVGDEFDGTITGVTSFGIFVDLDGIATSGLVHVTELPNDYYHFDPASHTLTGERRHRAFKLADRVRVTVARVDVDEREIDLVLVDAQE